MLDIDAPINAATSASVPEPDAAQVASFVDMGFTEAQAKKALRETVRFGTRSQTHGYILTHFQTVRKPRARR